MAYRKLEGLVPGGKQVDLAIRQHRWKDAEALARRAEQILTVRRRQVSQRRHSRKGRGRQWKIELATEKNLNQKIDALCEMLRGKDSLVRRAAGKHLRPRAPSPKRRRR